MFCINAFTAFESTFLSTYSFLYDGTLPIFLDGPLIDGDAAGWPIHSFIEMKFFFRVSFSSFAINFHSEMLKAWDGPFAERIFLATNNT